MSDRLDSFIDSQHNMNVKLSESLSRIEQSQRDTIQRLFGGDGQKGVLPYMIEQAEQTKKDVDAAHVKIIARVGTLENWKRSSRAWVAGAVAVLALEGTALGFYFNKIANHVTK